MTPDEQMQQYAKSNVNMIKYTYAALVKIYPDFSAGKLMEVATDLVAASIRCQGNYSV
jgi:hypothetical protein